MKVALFVIAIIVSGESFYVNNKYVLIPNPAVCTPHYCWRNNDCRWKKCEYNKVPQCVQYELPGASCCTCVDFVTSMSEIDYHEQSVTSKAEDDFVRSQESTKESFIIAEPRASTVFIHLYPDRNNNGNPFFLPYYPDHTGPPMKK